MSSNGNIFRVTGPLHGEFTGHWWIPAQRPVTQSCHVFFDLCLNKYLSKYPRRWWFEMPSCSLWHHCDALHIYGQNYNRTGHLNMDVTEMMFHFNSYMLFLSTADNPTPQKLWGFSRIGDGFWSDFAEKFCYSRELHNHHHDGESHRISKHDTDLIMETKIIIKLWINHQINYSYSSLYLPLWRS